MSNTASRTQFHLKDYKAPAFWIDKVDLTIRLNEAQTQVVAESHVIFNDKDWSWPQVLELDGDQLKLLDLKINGKKWTQFEEKNGKLFISEIPQEFTIEITTQIDPTSNKSGEGIYKSNNLYCTQCESQGFRKITYFVDRPDNMAIYSTRIEAPKAQYPFLLSNGNLVAKGDLENGRHFANWEDPFKKPSYLFALVAGDLDVIEDSFKTKSGKNVKLQVFADRGRGHRCQHAMDSLKWSMKWDEERFNLEYDLDLFMIVAVDDFNFGAMENKGLNIYNSVAALADAKTADDNTHYKITAIVGHEYFHNWTGNRVTCRDWFQLSLKEGLTVYRDQEFTADLFSRTFQRIEDVTGLRDAQFSEDAGPNAHPVRPLSAYSVDNFYTSTIYEKGAELIRMMEVILGREGFAKGIAKYFELFDGQAVTTDDFVHAMETANNADLKQFRLWYSQAGTPIVDVRSEHDIKSGKYTLHFKQTLPNTPDMSDKKPMHIPIKLGLVGMNSKKDLIDSNTLIQLKQTEMSVSFDGITEAVVPSLLRDFSAPVNLNYEYSDEDLLFLKANDSNLFNRFEASFRLQVAAIKDFYNAEKSSGSPKDYTALFKALADNLEHASEDPLFVSSILSTPSWGTFEQDMKDIDPISLDKAIDGFKKAKATALEKELCETFEDFKPGLEDFKLTPDAIGKRRLAGSALVLLSMLDDNKYLDWAEEMFNHPMMAARTPALGAFLNSKDQRANTIVKKFFDEFKNDGVIINKALYIKSALSYGGFSATLNEIKSSPEYNAKNSNNVRSVWRGLCWDNLSEFHKTSGENYKLLGDAVLEADKFNAHLSAGLVSTFDNFKRLAEPHHSLIKTQLERIVKTEGISANVFELATNALK